jgi:hypothetical protein
MRMATDSSPHPVRARSLCESCRFLRDVKGRRGQRYLLCTNEAIGVKYPPQPVLACRGYAAVPHLGG